MRVVVDTNVITRDDDLGRGPTVKEQLSTGGIRVLSVQPFLDLLTEQPS